MSISIVMPSFNRVDLIGQSIESVMAQTSARWELVIVDDHSTDDTSKVVEAYCKQDSRIRFFSRESGLKGADVCRNEGVRHSTGDYLIFLDSDDLLAPTCIEKRLEFIKSHSEIDMLVSQAQFFHESPGDSEYLVNRFDYANDLDRFLMNDNIWLITCPTWRREAFERVGGWDENLPCWQDWEQHIRALAKGINYRKVDRVDCYFRQGHSGRHAISGRTTTDYVAGALAATVEVSALLKGNEMLNKDRQGLLAFNIFELLHSLGREHRSGAARRLARQAYRQHVFSFTQWGHFLIHSTMLSTVRLGERAVEIWENRGHRYARRFRGQKLRGRVKISSDQRDRRQERSSA